MNKRVLKKPVLIMLYGFPGTGKTFFARQFCAEVSAAHLNGDQLRYELFEEPKYNKQENDIIDSLMSYMTEQFLETGTSVVYDMNAARQSQRRILRDIAIRAKAEVLIIWLQLDIETAFTRVVKRDRRKSDDKYTMELDRTTFESLIQSMQNPTRLEDYVVVSGKHTFFTQKNAVLKKLTERGLLAEETQSTHIVKPGLVNRVPNPVPGRVDTSRRNIIIR